MKPQTASKPKRRRLNGSKFKCQRKASLHPTALYVDLAATKGAAGQSGVFIQQPNGEQDIKMALLRVFGR
jgi:hypothetical protein